jgi:hypothetical protein
VSHIEKDQKKEMARQRLFDNLQKPLLAALEEGLTKKDVLEVIKKILEHET